MYSKNMSMRTIIFFTIVVVTGSTMSGDNNFCEQCCEYLGNCCKKGKGEVKEKFYLKKTETANPEEIKKLVSTDWYDKKGKEVSFILYEKIDNIVNGGLNENDIIKVTKYKNGFSVDKNFISEKDNNTQKWALFEIIYKKKGEEEENKENETKYLYCSDIESIENFGIFYNCQQHVSISVIACDTSGVTDMYNMFDGCSSLTELDLSNFNTEIVTNMSDMFYGCSSLTKLNLSEFDTKNVTDMSFMFYGCSSLTELDLSNFNTETVTCMCAMFSGCAYLQQLDLTNFNTGNVTDMDNMFLGCKALTELDLSNFNTNKVINMVIMFSECSSLQTVTFNKNLNKKIIKQLNDLGLTEKVEEEGNKITLKKK